MINYTRHDDDGLYLSQKATKAYLNPTYTGSDKPITELRPAWHENKELKRRFQMKRMEPGDVLCIEGMEVFRRKSVLIKYWVEGVEMTLEQAIAYIGKASQEDRPKKPYFVLYALEKRVIKYWVKFEDENRCPPYLTESARALKKSFQQIGGVIKDLEGYGVMYSEMSGSQVRWHVDRSRIQYVDLGD